MKIVVKLCILAYIIIAVYTVPFAFLPFANEDLVRRLSVLIIEESLALIGVFWWIHESIQDSVQQKEEKEIDNVEVIGTATQNIRNRGKQRA